jgi:hypothetical protein
VTGTGGIQTAAPGAGGGRTLVHRQRSWEPFGVAGAPGGEEEFVLCGELPLTDPVLGGGGRFHDLQAAAEMVRDTGELIGQSHFGVPAGRLGVFYRFALATRDVSAWRTGEQPARLTCALRVRPDKVIDSVPRALELRIALEIDEVPCGGGAANVVFLPPVTHRNHRMYSRGRVLATAAAAAAPAVPVDPGEVGRGAAGAVLVHSPAVLGGGRLTVGVRAPGAPEPGGQSPGGQAPGGQVPGGQVPALVQLETLRQTSLLAAGRVHRLVAERCTLAALKVHFRGYAEPGVAMRCAAVAGGCGRDGEGRRQAPVTLTLTQGGRAVVEAVATVVEDV